MDRIEFIYQVHYSENNFINDDNKRHLIKSLGIVSVWTQWAICNWSSEEKFLTFHIVRAVFVLIGSPKAE